MMTQAQEAVEGEAHTYLHEVTQWQGVAWHTQVKRGLIASTIFETIATTEADLTILCRYSQAGPVRWPLGRVAEKIARHAPSAVLLPDQAGSSLPEQDLRVLLPLDTSPFAEKAL